MVLVSKSNKLKISGKDKTCYKIVKFVQRGYITPEQETIIIESPKNKGIPYGTEFVAQGEVKADIYGFEDFCFGNGLIHTYKWKDSAKQIIRDCYSSDRNIELYECIIPKGIEFIEGKSNNIKRSYASKKIIFIKRIT